MRRGFTLIELLVASLLLGMLVSVLTMLFSTSSIAWRTGTAGVAKMNDMRRAIGTYHDIADNALPGLGDDDPSLGASDSRTIQYRVVSLWDSETGVLRTDRAFNYGTSINWGRAPSFSISDAMTGAKKDLTTDSGERNGSSLFTVGVRSAGPNGLFGDRDDITTWPEDAD